MQSLREANSIPATGQDAAGQLLDAEMNSLLVQLPKELLLELQSTCIPKRIRRGSKVMEAGTAPQPVLFVRRGLFSIVGLDQGTPRVEVASVGAEGLIGVGTILGDPAANQMAVAVSDCEVDELAVDQLNRMLPEWPELHRALLGYCSERMDQLAHTAACNALHRLEQRLARWIVVSTSRLGEATLNISHESLATLLGCRRASVTTTIHLLEGAGAIRAKRCRITIRDAGQLEELSCGCHRAILGGTAGEAVRVARAVEQGSPG